MADLKDFQENPQQQLFEALEDARMVMLGSTNPQMHMQPMSPQVDDEIVDSGEHVVYFYSDKTSDLGRTILTRPGDVHMCLVEKDYQACVHGRLEVADNPALINRFWSPAVAAWYPKGQSDPKMLMLKFTPKNASIWASTGNPLKFAWEITKANMTESMPDIGEHKNVNL